MGKTNFVLPLVQKLLNLHGCLDICPAHLYASSGDARPRPIGALHCALEASKDSVGRSRRIYERIKWDKNSLYCFSLTWTPGRLLEH